ncbi:hypothetical protein L6452_39357 [Arctium lappa]|uniref:Uncharacterized protein n=1 Tax=Arctium lappa TaxID=4217 RepID=A0ACB8XS18_ARCLA|nr:hypothetical protein L6452_39357 [Arctium lappa]
MYLFTVDRRMYCAHTAVHILFFHRKGSFVLFVILQWLDQMLLVYSVLQHRSDDLTFFIILLPASVLSIISLNMYRVPEPVVCNTSWGFFIDLLLFYVGYLLAGIEYLSLAAAAASR